ncbi:hypothetical protein BABINDRAFT_159143 [Babjeviella inositovora NRRL Y-12698]|uniref:Exonuclease V, mitochondrial n=1 Tax=Babjeviella inositovora NRRL Y-12698 TaxID=984486 RepID=A0A1E3QY73_9ASCO|nr:uncharacterized protein BABINDRAFT_159143 [Babjeviella inositovora NRRL Y-12698]ODQ82585.1 hypothetical protein BABINDRAFT_159143 [Babjeviella inositovora NRRL Y-12698]
MPAASNLRARPLHAFRRCRHSTSLTSERLRFAQVNAESVVLRVPKDRQIAVGPPGQAMDQSYRDHSIIDKYMAWVSAQMTVANAKRVKSGSTRKRVAMKAISKAPNKLREPSAEANRDHSTVYARLASSFQTTGSGYIAPIYLDTAVTPFHKLCSDIPGDLPNGRLSYASHPRLSITKMVPKYCELRDTFEIFGEVPRLTTVRMTDGTQIHEYFENVTYPEQARLTGLLEKYRPALQSKTGSSTDLLSSTALEMARTIARLQGLFTRGQAREVNLYGFIDSQTCRFVEPSQHQDSDSVFIGGIIDQLTLETKREVSVYDETPSLYSGCEEWRYNLLEFFNRAPAIIEECKDEYELCVTDIKTRRNKFIPIDPVQVQSAEYQVYYYRKMLGLLGAQGQHTYGILLSAAQRKNLDIDEPVDDWTMLELSVRHPELFHDRQLLEKGAPIGFTPYDQHQKRSQSLSVGIDWSSLEMEKFSTEFAKLSNSAAYSVDILQPWRYRFTLRHLAARLAQMYGLLPPFLPPESKCNVEYYVGKSLFKAKHYQYDEGALGVQMHDAVDFWYGRRQPRGVELARVGVCKSCEFKNVCESNRVLEEKKAQTADVSV